MIDHRSVDTAHQPVKLRIEDYLLLDRSGAFDAYAKTELLDGEILYMNAQHRPHAFFKSNLFLAIGGFLKQTGSQLSALVEASVTLSDYNLPEPDIVLTSEPHGEGPIPAASVALVIEVADTTQRIDLGKKAELYAAAGIPEYWVADVERRTFHQMWQPEAAEYRARRSIAFGEVVRSVSVAGLEVATDAL